eukprot:sb/3466081/
MGGRRRTFKLYRQPFSRYFALKVLKIGIELKRPTSTPHNLAIANKMAPMKTRPSNPLPPSQYPGVYKLDVDEDAPPTGVRRVYPTASIKPVDSPTLCNFIDLSDRKQGSSDVSDDQGTAGRSKPLTQKSISCGQLLATTAAAGPGGRIPKKSLTNFYPSLRNGSSVRKGSRSKGREWPLKEWHSDSISSADNQPDPSSALSVCHSATQRPISLSDETRVTCTSLNLKGTQLVDRRKIKQSPSVYRAALKPARADECTVRGNRTLFITPESFVVRVQSPNHINERNGIVILYPPQIINPIRHQLELRATALHKKFIISAFSVSQRHPEAHLSARLEPGLWLDVLSSCLMRRGLPALR